MEKGSWDHAHHVRSKYKPHKHGHHQDMSQPLSHYFISRQVCCLRVEA